MINKIYKIIITALRKMRILCGKFLLGLGRRYKGEGTRERDERVNVRMFEC